MKNFRQKRNQYLLLLGLLAAIAGCLSAFLYDQYQLSYAVQIISNLLAIAFIYLWIIYDAKSHHYRIPQYLKYLIILVSFIGVPIYFWQTRKFADFWINIGGFWLFAFYGIIYLLFTYIVAGIFL